MTSPQASDIRIEYDGDDITQYVLWQDARFECQANAIPGTFSLTVKDTNNTLSFTTGKELYLFIDDTKYFGGIVLRVGRKFAFPAVDTTDLGDVSARQWVLEGSDFNIWFDKRVIRNTDDYLHAIITDGEHTFQEMIVDRMPNYIDVPPGVNISRTYVDELFAPGDTDLWGAREVDSDPHQYEWVTQGTKWRQQMDEFAARRGAVYYLDADKNLHFHGLEASPKNWSFVDRDHNTTGRIACREITYQSDGSVIITDALGWGGLDVSTVPLFFSRYPDPDRFSDEAEQEAEANLAQYGRWQAGVQMFQEGNDQKSLDSRVKYIVMGPPGASGDTQTGVRFPLDRVTLSWFAHNVPIVGGVRDHLRPGFVINIILYALGTDLAHPLVKYLPLRSTVVTFPERPAEAGKSWVRFDGEFALSYGDSRYLWNYLLTKQGVFLPITVSDVTNTEVSAGTAVLGSFARLYFNETPNGVTTVFTLSVPIIASTFQVFRNGLLQRQGIEYQIIDATIGSIKWADAPLATDTLFVLARTGQL